MRGNGQLGLTRKQSRRPAWSEESSKSSSQNVSLSHACLTTTSPTNNHCRPFSSLYWPSTLNNTLFTIFKVTGPKHTLIKYWWPLLEWFGFRPRKVWRWVQYTTTMIQVFVVELCVCQMELPVLFTIYNFLILVPWTPFRIQIKKFVFYFSLVKCVSTGNFTSRFITVVHFVLSNCTLLPK